MLVRSARARHLKTYDKREQNKTMRSFKIDVLLDSPLETVARVYFDIENYDKWYWQVLDTKGVRYRVLLLFKTPCARRFAYS